MSGFEVVELGKTDLRIEIEPGAVHLGIAVDTSIRVIPPPSVEDHATLLENAEPNSELGKLLIAGFEKTDEWLEFTADGAPDESHIVIGTQLAKAIMRLKGYQVAEMIVTRGTRQNYHMTQYAIVATQGNPES